MKKRKKKIVDREIIDEKYRRQHSIDRDDWSNSKRLPEKVKIDFVI